MCLPFTELKYIISFVAEKHRMPVQVSEALRTIKGQIMSILSNNVVMAFRTLSALLNTSSLEGHWCISLLDIRSYHHAGPPITTILDERADLEHGRGLVYALEHV